LNILSNTLKKNINFCLGIDPSSEVLRAWKLDDNINGLKEFIRLILKKINNDLRIVKLQHAYFERFGEYGIKELKFFINELKHRGIITIIDSKKGDISETVNAYLDGMLFRDDGLNADAMTFNPYMGVDMLKDFAQNIYKNNKYIFIVVKSSNNPILQDAIIPKFSISISEYIAKCISDLNKQYDVFGAVIGGTCQSIQILLHILSDAFILVPGLGAQGATIDDIKKNFNTKHILPTASRSILNRGKNEFEKNLSYMLKDL
jgi:orotidine-5'-phosphate decarboxylase